MAEESRRRVLRNVGLRPLQTGLPEERRHPLLPDCLLRHALLRHALLLCHALLRDERGELLLNMLRDELGELLLKLLYGHAENLDHDGLLCDRQDLGDELLDDLLGLVGGLECERRLDAIPLREAGVGYGGNRRREAGCVATLLLRGGHARTGQALGYGGQCCVLS